MANEKLKLSQNKLSFFASNGTKDSIQLTPDKIHSIISQYKKEKIYIYINGETDYGKAFISTSETLLKEEIEMMQGLHKELMQSNQVNEEAIRKLSSEVDSEIKRLLNKKNDICLTKEEAWQEICHIQKNLLKDSKAVGYLFTSQHKSYAAHTEAFIITQNHIIRPISWDLAGTMDARQLTEANFFQAIDDAKLIQFPEEEDVMIGRKFPLAQADEIGCATLSILYLKELLRDDAKQLFSSSLCIKYYSKKNFFENNQLPNTANQEDLEKALLFFLEEKDFLNRIFIPSPQVLRYSQSELHNKVIEAMIKCEGEKIQITHKNKTYAITGLEHLLNNSMRLAKKNGDTEVFKDNETILKQLPSFREKWLEQYGEAAKKRNLMNDNGCNHYLSYSSLRMNKKANST